MVQSVKMIQPVNMIRPIKMVQQVEVIQLVKMIQPIKMVQLVKMIQLVRLIYLVIMMSRKIPKISSGAYIFQRTLLRGLFLEGAYYRREICVSKLAGLIIGRKFVSKFLNVRLIILGFWLEIRNKLITLKMPSSKKMAINFIRTEMQ